MMCIISAGKEFLRAIDASRCTKDKGYIVEVMMKYLIEFGPYDVVQICMDNASMISEVVGIINKTHMHIIQFL
jgi:hypothetical protein